MMLKLYKEIDGKLNYWETWDQGENVATIHWGIVGEEGQTTQVKSGLFSNFKDKVQQEIKKKLEDEYKQLDPESLRRLIIEYRIDGIGTSTDLEKRHRLEAKLNELLGWRGLGHCDGGSAGSGTMEVCCFVVNFDIAANTIRTELKNTEFSDYSRIYDEDD
jgi:hypothetical protein